MKELKSRTEIAPAINFHRYPVLTLDLVDKDEYGLKGCNVLVDFGKFNTGEPWYEKGELRVYRDECKFEIKAFGACLKKDFTYSDYKEILSYANAPIIIRWNGRIFASASNVPLSSAVATKTSMPLSICSVR